MDQVKLGAQRREGSGTRPSRRLRAGGDVPGVLYGRGLQNIPLKVNKRELYAALHTEAGTNALINLEVGGEEYITVARELQRHPVRGDIIHLDFINVSLTEKITAEVGIEFIGEPEGAKEGGILETIRTSVMLEALPLEIPASIPLDISGLDVGMNLTIGDLPAIAGVEYLDDPHAPVVNVIIPRILEVEAPAEELDEDGEPLAAALEDALGADGEAAEGGAEGSGEDEG